MFFLPSKVQIEFVRTNVHTYVRFKIFSGMFFNTELKLNFKTSINGEKVNFFLTLCFTFIRIHIMFQLCSTYVPVRNIVVSYSSVSNSSFWLLFLLIVWVLLPSFSFNFSVYYPCTLGSYENWNVGITNAITTQVKEYVIPQCIELIIKISKKFLYEWYNRIM